MENLSPTARVLHEEHMASQILLNRVEQAVRAHQPDRPPAVDDGPVNQLLGDLIAALEGEVRRHFAFEEEKIFPRLAEIGDGDIGASIGNALTRNSDPVRGVSAMLTDVFCARLPRHISPHAFSRIRGAVAYDSLAYNSLIYSNPAGGHPG